MQNAVYIRLILYVLSSLLGLIPAGWLGYVSYDSATSMLQINVEGAVTAVVSALAVSGGIFAKWGTK